MNGTVLSNISNLTIYLPSPTNITKMAYIKGFHDGVGLGFLIGATIVMLVVVMWSFKKEPQKNPIS